MFMQARSQSAWVRALLIVTGFLAISGTLLVLVLKSHHEFLASEQVRKALESIHVLKTPIKVLPSTPEDDARNATLGFETILALSRGTLWRVHGLQAAAKETGLDLTIPPQPPISDLVLDALQPTDPEHGMSRGQAKSWAAHLDLLRHIVASNYTTALILEDDVDWGLEIKNQTALLSSAFRRYTQTPQADTMPYGSSWDILWLGLCAEDWLGAESRTLSYPDASVGLRGDWIGIADPARFDGLPEGHRNVFRTHTAVCTWAYAVTRQSAVKLLEWAGQGGAGAFDVRLQQGCHEGGLTCYSVVDQMFHQYTPAPDMGISSEISSWDAGEHNSGGDAVEKVKGKTETILHSARCQALFGEGCYVGRGAGG